jgi:hypothetical protein
LERVEQTAKLSIKHEKNSFENREIQTNINELGSSQCSFEISLEINGTNSNSDPSSSVFPIHDSY